MEGLLSVVQKKALGGRERKQHMKIVQEQGVVGEA